MGAQAYSDDDLHSLVTTDSSWLAQRLCAVVMTDSERDEIDPEFAPGLRDGNAGAPASAVARADAAWPVRFYEFTQSTYATEWRGKHGQNYSRHDWLAARRFVRRCALRGVGFRVAF